LDRLGKVVERTTLGLFFHEIGTPLPRDYRCVVYAIDGFAKIDGTSEENLRRLVDQALCGRVRVFGEKVFSYWFQRVEGKEFTTLWAYLFYSRVGFLAMTLPPL